MFLGIIIIDFLTSWHLDLDAINKFLIVGCVLVKRHLLYANLTWMTPFLSPNMQMDALKTLIKEELYLNNGVYANWADDLDT